MLAYNCMAETTIYVQESTNVQHRGIICTLICNKLCDSLGLSNTYSNNGLCSFTCNTLCNQLIPFSQTDQFQHDSYLSQNLISPYGVSPNNFSPYGSANKVSIKISYKDISETSFLIATDFSLLYGKWTEDAIQCKETAVSNKKVNHNETVMIHACGRDYSPSGVEGSILLKYKTNSIDIDAYKIVFDNPFIGSNKFKLENLQNQIKEVICEYTGTVVNANINCYKI